MKASELREKDVDQLFGELNSLIQLAFSVKMKKMTGSVVSTAVTIRSIRKDIARVKFVLSEKGVSV